MENKTKDSWGISRFNRWWICVAVVYIPFLLFLALIWFHTAGGQIFDSYLASAAHSYASQLQSDLNIQLLMLLRMESQLVQYSGYLLVHCLLSFAVLIYFVAQYIHQKKHWQDGASSCTLFTLGYTVLILAMLTLIVITSNPFSNLTIGPFQQLADLTGLDQGFSKVSGNSRIYLISAQLLPIVAAVPAVIMASASFHLSIFAYPEEQSKSERLARQLKALKQGLGILSLILVSAVITAGFYFHMLPSILPNPDGKQELVAVYNQLSSSLSYAAGLLFSATLIAAFIPGATALFVRYQRISQSDCDPLELHTKMEKVGGGINLFQMVKIMIAVLAPAVTSPVLDAIKGLAV